MDEELERTFPEEVTEPKPVKRRRKRKKRRRSLLSRLKKGAWWGLAIGIALLSIIFAIISYNW